VFNATVKLAAVNMLHILLSSIIIIIIIINSSSSSSSGRNYCSGFLFKHDRQNMKFSHCHRFCENNILCKLY